MASLKTSECNFHIVNGDATVAILKAAQISGEYLPWRDVLHMGPVPETQTLASLSTIRAKFIADMGWAPFETVDDSFQHRDCQLRNSLDAPSRTLWFEHDLYDQLQILQILDYFQAHGVDLSSTFWIKTDIHLGRMVPADMLHLNSQKQPVTDDMLDLATRAWKAFRQPTPEDWFNLLDTDLSALPFLRNSILRALQELPDTITGLTQTEKMALQMIEQGITQRGQVFREYCQHETDEFHGDTGFFWYLDQLMVDSPALLVEQNDRLQLTDTGKRVLSGKAHWHRKYSQAHWLGGYAISEQRAYFWDDQHQTLVHRP